MGSRRQAESGDASVRAVSRRTLLAGASAVAVPAAAPIAGPATGLPPAAPELRSPTGGHLVRSWLRIDAQIERLQTRWAKLEAWLVREHRWCELSPAEQQALPWVRELRDIDGCLEVLFEKREALLERLPVAGAADLPELAERLEVVERLIVADDHPEANALVRGVRRDLQAWAASGLPSSGVKAVSGQV